MSETAEVAPHWTLGWRLQRSLAWAGVSVEEMARELDVSRSTISRWCHDQGSPPRSIYLRAWSHKCRVPYDWLISGDDTSRSDPQRPHCGTQGGYTPIHNQVTALGKPIRATDDELAARLASGIPVSSVLGSGQVVNS